MLRLTAQTPRVKVVFRPGGNAHVRRRPRRGHTPHDLLGGIPGKTKGLIHFSNEGVCSWYDFAHEIAVLAGLDPARVIPATPKSSPPLSKGPAIPCSTKPKQRDFQPNDTLLARCARAMSRTPGGANGRHGNLTLLAYDLPTQFTRHRRSRFYRQPCSTAAGQQISPIPNRQPRQTDLCREPRKPGGHRERAELHLRKGGHLRLREDAGNLPDIPNRRGHTPRSGKPWSTGRSRILSPSHGQM